MDLAKVGETKHLHFSIRDAELINKQINAFLKKGWVIVTVKIVEQRTAYRYEDGSRHPHAQCSLFYILGKPRERVDPGKDRPLTIGERGQKVSEAADGLRRPTKDTEQESAREFFERLDDQQAEAFHKEAAEAERQRMQRKYTECAVRLSAKIGKPFPVGASIEAVDAWLRQNLAIDDCDHPDFMLHAKGSS